MSKYTLELRELFTPIKFNPPIYSKSEVEAFFTDYNLSDYLTTDQIKAITDAGVWSKEKLASKIIDHYFMREIGQETIGLFKHYAKVEMQELMEQYLPMIYSASMEVNPLVNYKETFERTANVDNTGRSVSDSLNEASSLGVNSDSPQGQISKSAILAGNYATSTGATESTSNINNVTNTTSGSDSEEAYTKTVLGNMKSIREYRDNIRAIDREIIDKLEPLFMGLY